MLNNHKQLLLCAMVLCRMITVTLQQRYVVDEEHHEPRAQTGDKPVKERILIGYLAGTSLMLNLDENKSTKQKTHPLPLADKFTNKKLFPSPPNNNVNQNASGGGDDLRIVNLHNKTVVQFRHKRQKTARIYRDSSFPVKPSPPLNPPKRPVCTDASFLSMDEYDQAKYCFKQRPAATFLQGHYVSGALRYAVEKINADEHLLPNHTLEFQFIDTRGIPHLSVRAFIELLGKGAKAFIGPEDSCQTEAMMAASQNLPMISFKCFDHTVSDKTKYNTFIRTVPAEREISKAVISLLKQFKWTKFTIVHANTELAKTLVEAINIDAKEESMKILNTSMFTGPITEDNDGAENVKQIVLETYLKTRIYLVLGDIYAARLMLYEMDNLNLFVNGECEYMVVYVDPAFSYTNADDVSMNQIYRHRDTMINDFHASADLKRIIDLSRILMMVVPTPIHLTQGEYFQFVNAIIPYVMEPPFAFWTGDDKKHYVLQQHIPNNRYASYLYDAVYLYARGLHEHLLDGGSYTNGTGIITRLLNRQYESMQGFTMKIDENGDAQGNYSLLTRQQMGTSIHNLTHGIFQTGYFVQTNESLPALQLVDKLSIVWATPDKLPPIAEPKCGFNNERCKQEKTYVPEIVCGVLAGIVLICSIIGFIVYRNHKYEQELAGLIWKIDPKDIQFHPCPGLSGVAGSKMSIHSQESVDGEFSWSANPSGLAMYKGSLVAIKTILYPKNVRVITRATKVEMKNMRNLHHDNINSFMGIIVESNCIRVVREYCSKGSLFDVLLNETLKLDQLFVASFVDDLLKAMIYLHDSELRVHGNLKSTNCVVTSRWTLQVADFGLHELRDGQEFESEESVFYNLLWVAPELLRDDALQHPPKGTQKGDVYSFAIIFHEILSRKGPFDIYKDGCELTVKDVVENVFSERSTIYSPFRPNLADLELQSYVIDTMTSSWEEIPQRRPDFRFIRQRLKPMFKGILKRNIMDHMITMMEKYQTHLEELVDERTEELKEEKKRTEILLHRMLPKSVATQLIKGDEVMPESYDLVTIYFSDIVGFTSLSADSTPMEVVQFLNALYTLFDRIIRMCDVYKVETIGDAYMVVSGLPIRNGDKHSGEIATMALQLLEKVKEFQIPHRKDQPCLLRIGIHTGPCVAGVVGRTMPRYCLFGDTVNTASRMESNGLPLKIHISESTFAALDKLGGYITEERGLVPMKGKGEMRTYWLTGKQEMESFAPVDQPPTYEDALFPAQNKQVIRSRYKAGSATEQPVSTELAESNESLRTTMVRQTSGKRPELTYQNSIVGGSKLLQPAASRTTIQKAPPLTTQNSITSATLRQTSRLLASPASTVPTTAAEFLLKSRELSKNSTKRASEIYPVGSCPETTPVESEGRMRKRSLSFPENVQALAEQLVALGIGKNGEQTEPLIPRDKNLATSQFVSSINSLKSSSNSKLLQKQAASPCTDSALLQSMNGSRECTVDQSQVPLLLDFGPSPQATPPDRPQPNYSSLLLQPVTSAESVPANSQLVTVSSSLDSTSPLRKRSMSCSDAENPQQLSLSRKSPSPLLNDSGRPSESHPTVCLRSGNMVRFQTDSSSSRSGTPSPLRQKHRDRMDDRNVLIEEDDLLAESAPLFDLNRSKRHRKSLTSLSNAISSGSKDSARWYPNGGGNGTASGGSGRIEPGLHYGSPTGGSMPKLNRFFRYFKRQTSEDTTDYEPEPSVV